LPEGDVTLVAAGNAATSQVSVTVDSEPISISIATPIDGLVTKDAEVQVTGDVGSGVTKVSVNGVAVTSDVFGGSFSATVPLREGKNMIVAVAEKANGKTGTNSVDITRDIVAPIVSIDTPRDQFVSVEDKITIAGKVNDIVRGTTDPRVFVNGVEAVVANGSFMLMDLPLVAGPNTIEAVATDSVGNEGRHSVTVTFQKAVGARIGVTSGNGQGAES